MSGQPAVEDFVFPSDQDIGSTDWADMLEAADISGAMHGMTVNPEDGGNDESFQPTLEDILQAVQKCTASVDDLKELGGLREVSLLRQDLQKIRERTTVVEGRISDLEDQLPSLPVMPEWPLNRWQLLTKRWIT